MAESGRKVEVRFGAFSCSVEGYDNPVEQMREVLMLMQRMIHETPALADHGPEFGEADVARIENALDRRAEHHADGPCIVVMRGPEARRAGEAEDHAEDAVVADTRATIPGIDLAEEEVAPEPADPRAVPPPSAAIYAAPVAPHAAEDAGAAAGDPAGDADIAAALDGDEAVASGETETDAPASESPLADVAGATPAAAIFPAPAAAMAEAAFSADLAFLEGNGTDGNGDQCAEDPFAAAAPHASERAGPAIAAATQLVAEALPGSEEQAGGADQPGATSRADAPELPESAEPAEEASSAAEEPLPGSLPPQARAEEANHLWTSAAEAGLQPAADAGDEARGAQVNQGGAADTEDTDQGHSGGMHDSGLAGSAPAEQPNRLWAEAGMEAQARSTTGAPPTDGDLGDLRPAGADAAHEAEPHHEMAMAAAADAGPRPSIFAPPPEAITTAPIINIFAPPPEPVSAAPGVNIFAPPLERIAEATPRKSIFASAAPSAPRVPGATPPAAQPSPGTVGLTDEAAIPVPGAFRREPGPAAAFDTVEAGACHQGAREADGEPADGTGETTGGLSAEPAHDRSDYDGEAGQDDQERDGTPAFPPSSFAPAAAEEPARPVEERSRFSALLARLGGHREVVAEPDIAQPRERNGERDGIGADAGPAGLAERAGAQTVADLLAVAAAWLTLVEGKPRFTRREVMETFERLPGDHPRTLEARIKGFGKLVRSSTLVLVDDGVFAMAQAERDRYQLMIDEG